MIKYGQQLKYPQKHTEFIAPHMRILKHKFYEWAYLILCPQWGTAGQNWRCWLKKMGVL